MAELHYSKQAIKYLRRMPYSHAQKMRLALRNIAARRNKGLDIKLMSEQKAFRLRQGNYRAMYAFRNEGRTVMVVKVGTRGDFYK